MARRLGIFLLWIAGALLAVTAYWLLFTVFMAYDDEGYVLISLKNYSAHGGLYAQVYSQYGPFFYALHDLGHRVLGYAFTNTNGRLITLLCWLATAGASAHLIWRQTRMVTLTGFTLGLTFFHLWLMVSEPLHPGGLIAALVALGAWLGAMLIERRALTALAVTAGLLGAALLLTKINVGVFFLAATGAWFAAHLKNLRHARSATLISGGLLALLPIALMRAKLDDTWGRLFCALAVIAAVTMLAAAWRDRQPLTSWSQATWGTVAAVGLGALVIVAVCLRGTNLPELLDGILLGPLRHPGVYSFAPAWKPGATLAGGVSLMLAGLVWLDRNGRLSWLIVSLRLVLVLVYCITCFEWLPFTNFSFTMSYLVPLAWIFAVRLVPDDKNDASPRAATWIGLLLVLQYLHAYPVAGSQVAWGTFLIVPLMALGLHDTGRYVAARQLNRLPFILGATCLCLAAGVTGRLVALGEQRYAASRPLLLPGAEDLRLPENFASALRILTLNATAHGDMLFSLPGMFSFNTWTRLPPPTLADTTHWFTLLTPGQQDDIATALTRSARPVIIVQRGLLDFLADHKFSTTGPLEEYLRQNFEKVLGLQQYELWVRRGRQIARLGTAELLHLDVPQPGLAPARLEITTAVPAGRTIARIELATLDETPRTLGRWDKSNGALSALGLDLTGRVLTPPNDTAWAQPLPPLVRLVLSLDKAPMFDRRNAVLYVRDANGELLAEARFTD